MKRILVVVDDFTFEALKAKKGDRTWEQYLIETI